ncbi:MAG: TlpA family protein disulfide reductase [Planctomycetes bacterium]|nr:TlpA family protein disulfide reductase [Planctomycetota bacterium]
MNRAILVQLAACSALTLVPIEPCKVWAAPALSVAAVDAATIIKEAREAVTKAQAISYSARTFGVGALEGKVPGSTAEVAAARADAGGWRLYIKGKADGGAAVEIGYDGVTARSIREADKVVVEKTISDTTDLAVFLSSQQAKHQVAWEILGDSPLAGDEALAKLEGEGKAGGQDCHIVFFPAPAKAEPDMEGGVRVYIAKSDLMPRRIERVVLPAEKPKDGPTPTKDARVLELTELRIGQEAASGAYNLEVPSGFRVKVAESTSKKQTANKDKPKGEPPAAPGLLKVGDKAPDWELADPAGAKYKLSDLKGKVVVMDFWATWCGPCKMAMPGVQKLHERFKDQPVMVFGVNCWERADAAAYMKKQKFTYTTLLKGDEVAKAYKVTGIPTFYVVGPDGNILYTSVGFAQENETAIANVIEKALPK